MDADVVAEDVWELVAEVVAEVVAEAEAITVAEVVVIKMEVMPVVAEAEDRLIVIQRIVLQLLTRRDTLQLLVTGP